MGFSPHSCFALFRKLLVRNTSKTFWTSRSSPVASSPRQSLPGAECESRLQEQKKLTIRCSAQVLVFLAQHTYFRDSYGIFWMLCSRKPLFVTQPYHLCPEDCTNDFSLITIEGDGRKKKNQGKIKKKKKIVPLTSQKHLTEQCKDRSCEYKSNWGQKGKMREVNPWGQGRPLPLLGAPSMGKDRAGY